MSLETKMQEFVRRLGLPLDVVHLPDPNSSKHGEIKGGVILIYDIDEDSAWITLLHETTEYRLRDLTGPYRRLVNKLIETVEGEVYAKKEKVLDQVLSDFRVWRNLEAESRGSTNLEKASRGSD